MDPNGATYQRTALRILPILVRQAKARRPIYYGDLAAELGISNPRTLNWPLGSVGVSLTSLEEAWGIRIPRIQALVVKQAGKIPGTGFMEAFVPPEVLRSADNLLRQQIVTAMLSDVYAFKNWDRVLAHFQLRSLPPIDSRILDAAAHFRAGGEGEAHKALKTFIAAHPDSIGLRGHKLSVGLEYSLPSGDTIDVLFKSKDRWTAVEVKSHVSTSSDVVRGIFQCVKYEAVLDALLRVQALSCDVHLVLALGGPLPPVAKQLATALGVQVVENVRLPGMVRAARPTSRVDTRG